MNYRMLCTLTLASLFYSLNSMDTALKQHSVPQQSIMLRAFEILYKRVRPSIDPAASHALRLNSIDQTIIETMQKTPCESYEAVIAQHAKNAERGSKDYKDIVANSLYYLIPEQAPYSVEQQKLIDLITKYEQSLGLHEGILADIESRTHATKSQAADSMHRLYEQALCAIIPQATASQQFNMLKKLVFFTEEVNLQSEQSAEYIRLQQLLEYGINPNALNSENRSIVSVIRTALSSESFSKDEKTCLNNKLTLLKMYGARKVPQESKQQTLLHDLAQFYKKELLVIATLPDEIRVVELTELAARLRTKSLNREFGALPILKQLLIDMKQTELNGSVVSSDATKQKNNFPLTIEEFCTCVFANAAPQEHATLIKVMIKYAKKLFPATDWVALSSRILDDKYTAMRSLREKAIVDIIMHSAQENTIDETQCATLNPTAQDIPTEQPISQQDLQRSIQLYKNDLMSLSFLPVEERSADLNELITFLYNKEINHGLSAASILKHLLTHIQQHDGISSITEAFCSCALVNAPEQEQESLVTTINEHAKQLFPSTYLAELSESIVDAHQHALRSMREKALSITINYTADKEQFVALNYALDNPLQFEQLVLNNINLEAKNENGQTIADIIKQCPAKYAHVIQSPIGAIGRITTKELLDEGALKSPFYLQ